MKQLKALLIGYSVPEILSQTLKKANFEIDLIIIESKNYKQSLRNKFNSFNSVNTLKELLNTLSVNFIYDLVVLLDDRTVADVSKLDLLDNIKIKFLPIASIDKILYLSSKIGLSNILKKNEFNTPSFEVVQNESELESCANKVTYPLMVKMDFSSGGQGVYKCNSYEEILSYKEKYSYPLLIQKYILGDVIDLSGFYQKEQLIHFTYSRVEKSYPNKYGPSYLRTYYQLSCVESTVLKELINLGKIISANGFTNVTAIYSKSENKRYYIEADMRPNVWFDFGKFMGNDLTFALRNYFTNRQILTEFASLKTSLPKFKTIPYYERMKFFQVFINKFQCWDYIRANDIELVRYLISLIAQKVRSLTSRILQKTFVPKLFLKNIRIIYRKYILPIKITQFRNVTFVKA